MMTICPHLSKVLNPGYMACVIDHIANLRKIFLLNMPYAMVGLNLVENIMAWFKSRVAQHPNFLRDSELQ